MMIVRNVSQWYGETCVLSDISLQLETGQCLHLRGENGSGKSTFLNILAGFHKPTKGSIEMDVNCCLLNDRQALKSYLTVRDHLLLWKALYETTQSITQVLAQWNIEHLESVPVQVLSLGQRKRVQLCQLLLSPAPLWLLDEPHHGLDRQGLVHLKELIRAHLRKGGAVIIAHHGSFDDIPGAILDLSRRKRSLTC